MTESRVDVTASGRNDDELVDGSWWTGVARSMPILFGYIPVGFAFGVLALQAGLSPLNTVLMSLMVLGASSQLIAIQLLSTAVPILTVVLTTLLVNLRHMLMSASLSPHLRSWRRFEIALFAYGLTDEAFALHSMQIAEGRLRRAEAIAIDIMSHASWVFGTWLGVAAGDLIDNVRFLALDYALQAMFIILIVLQIRNRSQILVVAVAGALSMMLIMSGVAYWNVVIATIVGSTLGTVVERWTKNTSS